VRRRQPSVSDGEPGETAPLDEDGRRRRHQPHHGHRPGQVVENGPPAGEEHPACGEQGEGGGGKETGTRLGPDGQHRIGASAPELTEAVDVGPGDAAGQGVADGATGQGDDQQGSESDRQAAGTQQPLLDAGDGEEGDGLGPGGDGDPAPVRPPEQGGDPGQLVAARNDHHRHKHGRR
jgi:hypothetical protein